MSHSSHQFLRGGKSIFPSGWWDLPPEASYRIEAARNARKDKVEYLQRHDEENNLWDWYQLVFNTSMQTNMRNSEMRGARRIMLTFADTSEQHAQGVSEDPGHGTQEVQVEPCEQPSLANCLYVPASEFVAQSICASLCMCQ